MKRIIFGLAMAASLCGVLPRAQATPLPPGSSGVAVSTTTLVGGAFDPAILTDSGSAPGGATGTLISRVYREASGLLTFVYQLRNTSPVAESLRGLSVVGYSGFMVDVNQLAAGDTPSGFVGGTISSSDASRSGAPGNTVNYDFDSPIPPGSNSVVLVVRTNATQFSRGVAGFLNGGASGPIAAFVPVPEPATLVLMGGCFAGLGGARALRRWRKGPSA